MKYGEAIKKSMEELAKDERTIFIGYNLTRGSKGYGSLKDIPTEKIIEMPVAENLIVGIGIGLAIEGLKPILIYERHDFMLNALDGIVNHLDKLEKLSYGEYLPKVIIRAIVGSDKPIHPGPQHMQDFTEAYRKMINMPIYDPKNPKQVLEIYEKLINSEGPSMVIERRDLYDLYT